MAARSAAAHGPLAGPETLAAVVVGRRRRTRSPYPRDPGPEPAPPCVQLKHARPHRRLVIAPAAHGCTTVIAGSRKSREHLAGISPAQRHAVTLCNATPLFDCSSGSRARRPSCLHWLLGAARRRGHALQFHMQAILACCVRSRILLAGDPVSTDQRAPRRPLCLPGPCRVHTYVRSGPIRRRAAAGDAHHPHSDLTMPGPAAS